MPPVSKKESHLLQKQSRIKRFIKWWGTIPPARLCLAAVSGLMLTAAFPNIGMAWLAWIALVPLFFAVRGLTPGRRFGVGFVFGAVYFFLLMYWLFPTLCRYGEIPALFAAVLFVGLILALAVYLGLFAMALGNWFDRPGGGAMAAAGIWVAIEYVRSFLFSGMPWELLGYSQFEHLQLIQLADVTGVYGISFLIAWANAAIFSLFNTFWLSKDQAGQYEKRAAVAVIVCFPVAIGLTLGYGKQRLAKIDNLTAEAPTMAMSVVQGNIDQARKWEPAYRQGTVEKYMALAGRSEPESRLAIMPETAMPFYFYYDEDLTRMVLESARNLGRYVLVGAPAFAYLNNRLTFYNSAYLIAPDGEVTDRYDKVHLVPFGEYIPFGDWMPFIEQIVYGAGDFSPGKSGKVLPLDDWLLGVQICYEMIFPQGGRHMVQQGADVLINITNDAWYGKTSAPYQHFSMTVLRAVEMRRALVRSANTGISGFVKPSGRIGGATEIFTDAVETYSVPKLKVMSLYTRIGDLFAKICVIFSGFMLWQEYKRKAGNQPDQNR